MNVTHPFLDLGGDKLREECGIFGAINAADAAAATALGLHALQHRGQEAVGISSFDGKDFISRRALGHVAENFSSQEAIDELPGAMAAGHVRYSTTGGAGLRNVQPLYAELASGGFALALPVSALCHQHTFSNGGAQHRPRDVGLRIVLDPGVQNAPNGTGFHHHMKARARGAGDDGLFHGLGRDKLQNIPLGAAVTLKKAQRLCRQGEPRWL